MSNTPHSTYTLLINCINDTDDVRMIDNLSKTDELFCIDETYKEIPGMEQFNDKGVLRFSCDMTDEYKFKQIIDCTVKPFDRCIIGGFGNYGDFDLEAYVKFIASHITVLEFLRSFGIPTTYRPILALTDTNTGTPTYEWTDCVKKLLVLFEKAGLKLASVEDTAALEVELYN